MRENWNGFRFGLSESSGRRRKSMDRIWKKTMKKNRWKMIVRFLLRKCFRALGGFLPFVRDGLYKHVFRREKETLDLAGMAHRVVIARSSSITSESALRTVHPEGHMWLQKPYQRQVPRVHLAESLPYAVSQIGADFVKT